MKEKKRLEFANSSRHCELKDIASNVVEFDTSSRIASRHANLRQFYELGEKFIRDCEQSFARTLETYAYETQKRHKAELRRFLTFLIQLRKNGFHAPFFQKLLTNSQLTVRAEWELVQQDYRLHLEKRKEIANRTKAGYINTLRLVLRAFSNDGIIPHLSWLVSFDRRARNDGTVGQLQKQNHIQVALQLSLSGQPCSPMEAKSIVGAYQSILIAHEEENVQWSASKVLAEINEKLARIRSKCEDIFLEEEGKLRYGRALLECSTIDFNSVDKRVCSETPDWLETFGRAEDAFGKVLRYIAEKWGCVPPAKDEHRVSRRLTSYVHHTFGKSVEQLDAHLNPSIVMQAAGAVILMIDTAANPTPIFELDRENVIEQDKDYPKYRWLSWEKRRAGGRQLRKLLPVHDPDKRVTSVRVVETIKKHSELLAQMAGPFNSSYLFLSMRRQGKHSTKVDKDSKFPIRNISASTMVAEIKAIFGSITETDCKHITPRLIRYFVLLRIALTTGDVFAVRDEAQHASLRTSWDYAEKLPGAIRNESLIRQFLTSLESSVRLRAGTRSIPINLCNDANTAPPSEPIIVGTGLACKDPLAGIQEGTKQGEVCHRVDACLSCENATTTLQGDVKTLTDLLKWKAHLEKESERMQRSNPARWNEIWLPWLVFCEVVQEKAESSLIFRIPLRAAKDAAATSQTEFPPLW